MIKGLWSLSGSSGDSRRYTCENERFTESAPEDATPSGPPILIVSSEAGPCLNVLGNSVRASEDDGSWTFELAASGEDRRLRLTDLTVAVRFFLGTISETLLRQPECGSLITIRMPGSPFYGNWRIEPDLEWLADESSVTVVKQIIDRHVTVRPRVVRSKKRMRDDASSSATVIKSEVVSS